MHPPLYYATDNGHTSAMSLLLEHGADPNYVDSVSENNIDESLLHIAASDNNAAGIQLLIDYGANINSCDCFGNSPYVGSNDKDVCAILLRMGANPNEIPHYGSDGLDTNKLHYAASHNDIDLAQLMLDYGIDINSCARRCITPFHCAVEHNYIDMMEFLVSKGADMNMREIDWGKQAIHIAACKGNIDSIQWLLNRGITVDAQDSYNHIPLHWAAYEGRIDTVKYLISKGANVNNINQFGESILYDADRSHHRNEDVVEILISNGAKVVRPDTRWK